MKKNTEKIDRYFKTRLGQFEQEPLEKVWKDIAVKLGHGRRRNMVMFVVRIAAGMALIVSLGIGYYFMTRPGIQIEPVKLAKNQASSTPGDTIKERPPVNEKVRPAIPAKKTGKSDRHERVRKIYKGPAVNEESPAGHESGNLTSEITDRRLRNQNLYRKEVPAEILHHEQQSIIRVDMPASLSRYPASPAAVITAEEARAILLSGSETMVENNGTKQNRWILGGEVAPLYSYRTIASDYLEPSMISNLNDAENGIIAYAGGIRVAFSASRRISVQSGVYYSRYGQEKNDIETYSFSNTEITGTMDDIGYYMAIPNSTGSIQSSTPGNYINDLAIPGSVRSESDVSYFASLNGLNYTDLVPVTDDPVSITQYFDYLEFPLILKYKVIDRKFGFSLSGGLVTNFLVNNVVSLEQNGEKNRFGKTSDINGINYLSSFGLGFEYPIVTGLAFSIEPRFRYYLNPIDKSSQINVHPYSFGIFAGLSYIF